MEPFYVRCFAFGKKQNYNPNHIIEFKEQVVFAFQGKGRSSDAAPSRIERTVMAQKPRESLAGIIRQGEKFMKKEYPDYVGEDLVEGLEISQEKDRTYVWMYRPFALADQVVFDRKEKVGEDAKGEEMNPATQETENK